MIADRRVVVTGKIAGETRQTAEQKLREAGAIVQSAVNKDTDILVIGSAVGAKKMNAARDLGVTVVPWEQAFGSSGGSKQVPPPRAPMPALRQWAPMLCKGATEIPDGSGWLFEIKWDGIRGIATVRDGDVSLQSRSGKSDLTLRFPWICEELAGFPDCVLDGELVPLSGDLARPGPLGGAPDPGGPVVDRFIVFDVLEYDGKELTKLPLVDRRQVLDVIIPASENVAVSPVWPDGEDVLDYVIAARMEGVVAKKGRSTYLEGGRNESWLKIKVRREQEFIVLGYTDGEGARAGTFGALVLGYYDEAGKIQYAGKVGTGFDDDCLRMLLAEMAPHVWSKPRGSCPWDFEGMSSLVTETTWLALPAIVVQVAFQKWTDDGRLWHPAYLRLRDDKEAGDVVREP